MGRARSGAPSFSRTAASSPKLPTCRSTPISKTATPMIHKKPQRSCVMRLRWALLGVLSRIGAASASMISAHAVERVAAGVEMARSLPVPFTFVARAENLIRGRPDLDDTIKRLQAFEKAGADVLYAPGLRDLGDHAHSPCRR